MSNNVEYMSLLTWDSHIFFCRVYSKKFCPFLKMGFALIGFCWWLVGRLVGGVFMCLVLQIQSLTYTRQAFGHRATLSGVFQKEQGWRIEGTQTQADMVKWLLATIWRQKNGEKVIVVFFFLINSTYTVDHPQGKIPYTSHIIQNQS